MVSEWLESQKKINSDFKKLLKERIEKAYPRRELTAEENKRLRRLEGIVDKLKHGENVKNRQLQTWLNEEEYNQLEHQWQDQLVQRQI